MIGESTVPARRQRLGAPWVVPAVLFLYLVFARTRHVADTFVLLGDQILYWTMALGPFDELPLVGPSSVGGTTLGPTFIWTVWSIRVVIGPWLDNLPHAGGIGIALLQSAADALLIVAIWQRTGSALLSLGTVLLIATGPLDLALSATIWNPPVATAFIKAAIALVLLEPMTPRPPAWWGLGAVACAVLAVQAHSSAIFVAAPLIAAFPAREFVARGWQSGLRRVRDTIELVAILEIPYLLNLIINRPERVAPAMVLEGVTKSVSGISFRLRDSFEAFASSTGTILFAPWSVPWFGPVLVVCLAVAAYRLRRDALLFAAIVAPVLVSILGFSTWQRNFDTYWFLTLAPPTALVLAFSLTGLRFGTTALSAALLAAIAIAQPARLAASMTSHRLPEYGALLEGTREIRRRAPEVRAIATDFSLPPSADRTFLYRILGGRITPEAPFIARINTKGEVDFLPADRP